MSRILAIKDKKKTGSTVQVVSYMNIANNQKIYENADATTVTIH